MRKHISGWGNTSIVESESLNPATISEVQKYCKNEEAFVIRGMGRSYGDSAVYTKHLHMRGLKKLIAFDQEHGTLCAEAGITLGEIVSFTVPKGWFLGTTPGTKFVTLGGAIASDVHGKNHHHYGCFSRGVLELTLVNEKGTLHTVTPNDAMFQYICGGMGLYGVIVQATIQLIRIHSAYITQKTYKAKNIAQLCTLMNENYNATYSVAWLSCLGNKRTLGRGLLMTGEHCNDGHFDIPKKNPKSVPIMMSGFLCNSAIIQAFNALYYHKALFKKSTQRVSYETFFYPLDGIHHWNRMYGTQGFTQYHCVLPKQRGIEGIEKLLQTISASGMGSFLSVLKLLGTQNDNLLSFPQEGYTLALDFKMSDETRQLFHTLDEIVLAYEGRLYLTKDVCTSAEMVQAGYKGYEQFVKNRKSAKKTFTSLQAQRLKL